MKLRSHLYILMAGTLLPMILFGAIAGVILVERERAIFQRGATERTLALVTAVDAELKSSITTLEGLATSASLDRANFRAFHDEAWRVLKSQPDWFGINLAEPGGQQVVNVLQPYGTAL